MRGGTFYKPDVHLASILRMRHRLFTSPFYAVFVVFSLFHQCIHIPSALMSELVNYFSMFSSRFVAVVISVRLVIFLYYATICILDC